VALNPPNSERISPILLITRRSTFWLAATLALVASSAIPSFTYPIGRDQATYLVVARGLLRGAKLYRDVWDMKPPGVFWVYMPVVKAFDAVMWSVGAVDIVWLLLISACIFVFAERYLGTAAAVIAVLVNAYWHCRAGYVNAAQPETFLTLFVFAAYFLVWGRSRRSDAAGEDTGATARHFAGGVLFGAAFWMKYNALGFLPLFLMAPYLQANNDGKGGAFSPAVNGGPTDSKTKIESAPSAGLKPRPSAWAALAGVKPRPSVRPSLALAFAAGLLTAIAAVLAYFRVAGLWTALVENHFRAIRYYGSSPIHYRPDYWLVPIAGTVAFLGFFTLFAPLAAYLVARRRRETARVAPVCLAAALAYASVVIQLRFAQYAFENCYPFFAMAWGYLAVQAFAGARSLDRSFATQGRRAARTAVWLAAGAVALWPLAAQAQSLATRYRWLGEWRSNAEQFYAHYPAPHPLEHLGGQMAVIDYLKQHARPDDKIYVWGAHPLIYYLTGLDTVTRFIPNLPLMAVWGPPSWRAELIRDLMASPPAFIIVARHDDIFPVTFTHLDSEGYLKEFPALNALIAGSYRQVAGFPDFAVYQRTGVTMSNGQR